MCGRQSYSRGDWIKNQYALVDTGADATTGLLWVCQQGKLIWKCGPSLTDAQDGKIASYGVYDVDFDVLDGDGSYKRMTRQMVASDVTRIIWDVGTLESDGYYLGHAASYQLQGNSLVGAPLIQLRGGKSYHVSVRVVPRHQDQVCPLQLGEASGSSGPGLFAEFRSEEVAGDQANNAPLDFPSNMLGDPVTVKGQAAPVYLRL